MLKISKSISDNKAVYSLEGKLDTLTAPDLDKELKESLDGISELTLDFEKLEYISSAGLRVLITAQKVMSKQGSMKLIHVNEIVREVFEITGLSDSMNIE